MQLTLFNPNNISKFNNKSHTNENTQTDMTGAKPLFSISYTWHCFNFTLHQRSGHNDLLFW